MHIEFSSNRLTEAGRNLSAASRLFGITIGREYLQRLAIVRATDKFPQLYGLKALRLHALKGRRAGQYSIALTGNYRLIINKIEEEKISIIAVEDYHGN